MTSASVLEGDDPLPWRGGLGCSTVPVESVMCACTTWESLALRRESASLRRSDGCGLETEMEYAMRTGKPVAGSWRLIALPNRVNRRRRLGASLTLV